MYLKNLRMGISIKKRSGKNLLSFVEYNLHSW